MEGEEAVLRVHRIAVALTEGDEIDDDGGLNRDGEDDTIPTTSYEKCKIG